jgi:hypothetical protein
VHQFLERNWQTSGLRARGRADGTSRLVFRRRRNRSPLDGVAPIVRLDLGVHQAVLAVDHGHVVNPIAVDVDVVLLELVALRLELTHDGVRDPVVLHTVGVQENYRQHRERNTDDEHENCVRLPFEEHDDAHDDAGQTHDQNDPPHGKSFRVVPTECRQ